MDEVFESRLGKVFVILYSAVTILVYIVSAVCGTESCQVNIVWPIMPWAFILAEDMGITFSWALYPLFILINASVAYVLGAMVEWVYHWTRERGDGSF